MKENIELCIRNKDGYIIAWIVGMSNDEIEEFLKNNPGSYRSYEVI